MAPNKRAYCDVRDLFVRGKRDRPTKRTLDADGENVFFVRLSSSVVLMGLTHPAVFHFQGILSVKCVYGKIDCLGHRSFGNESNMNAEFTVFSLCDRSAMYLSTFDGPVDHSSGLTALKEFDIAQTKINAIVERVGTQGAVLLASSKLYNYQHWDRVLQSANLSIFPEEKRTVSTSHKNIENMLECNISTTEDYHLSSRLSPHPSWSDVGNTLVNSKDTPKVLIYGGKGVGKSTALKFLINQFRSLTNREVLFVDLDVGQSEFTICGSVSAVKITEPLLGSNFTHLKLPVKSCHLGAIDVNQCLGSYFECVQTIVEYCEERFSSNVPWFINTMGMHKGIGTRLLGKIICAVRPNHVIEVKSSRSDGNFPVSFSESYVNELFPQSNLKFTFLSMASNAPSNAMSTKSLSLRNIVAYVYFSKILSTPSLDSVKFCRVTETEHAGLALGDVVALCQNGRLGHCFGYGLIVALTGESSVIGVVSPLPNKAFQAIDSILRTNINLTALSLFQGFSEREGSVSHFSRFDVAKVKRKSSKIDLYKLLFSTDV